MRIAAYQFTVTGNIDANYEMIQKAVVEAKEKQIRLLIFPECALTGYPPYDIPDAASVRFDKVSYYCDLIQKLAIKYNMYIIVGTITKEEKNIYNAAYVFYPSEKSEMYVYYKRALWGWDKDNFVPGNQNGVVVVDGVRVGIRICFEIRFPEYFRELYKEKTDLNVVLFYDICEYENVTRYEMIKGHIQTRAVENVCVSLSVNSSKEYQTAPTAVFDRSGLVLSELERNKEGLLCFEYESKEPDFGEQGRIWFSDKLVCVDVKKHSDARILLSNLDKLHMTELGAERIRRNLSLDVTDVVEWCKQKVEAQDSNIIRQGKIGM